jgi:hypothetical protein
VSRTSDAGVVTAEAYPTMEVEVSRTSDAGVVTQNGSPTMTAYAHVEGDIDAPASGPDLIPINSRPRQSHALRFIAQDIRPGRWLDWDLPLVDPEITWTLSGPTVIRARLKPEYRPLAELGIDGWATWIHVEDDGEIIASGILQPNGPDDDSYIVEAIGVSGYAQKMPYLGEDSFIEVDTCVVLRKIWDHLQSYPDAKLGVQITGSTSCGTLLGSPAQAAVDPATGEVQTSTSSTGGTDTGGGSGVRPAWGVPAGMKGLIDQDPSDHQVPWKIPSGADHVDIYFYAPASNGVTSEWLGYIKKGAALWNQSPPLNCIVTQSAVPAGKNKVTMKINDGGGDDGNFDAVEKGGYTTGGEIQILKTLKGGSGGGERQNVTTHEMGHAVGLAHRKQSRVLMNGDTYSDVFIPDATDRKNLLYMYGKQLPGGHTNGGSPTSSSSTTSTSATVTSTTTDPTTGVQTVTYSDGSTKTLTPKVDEAKPYVLAWYDDRDCGQEFDNLAKAAGVDYVERVGWDPTRTFVNHAIELNYPRAGRKRLDLRCALDENLLDTFPLPETTAQFASQILVRGAGKGRAAIRGYAGSPDPKRVRRVATVSDQTISDTATANSTAEEERLRRLAAVSIGEITLDADHPDMPLGSYSAGDDVLITATLDYVGRVELWHRIIEYTWHPDAGQVVAQVRRSEQFAYGRRPTARASGYAGAVAPDKFVMAFGSSLDGGDSAVFKTIAEQTPDYLALLGDLWHDDGGSGHLEHWQKALNAPNLGALVQKLPNPVLLGLSAHEGFAPNATAGPAFDRANIDYRRLYPGLKLLAEKGIYRRIDRGRVRIIQLDCRTFKSPNDAPDDPLKTMLGLQQKAWFKAMLGSPCYPVIIVIGDMPWNSPKVDRADSWAGYTTERTELAAAYQASPAKIIVQLEGGAHSLAKATNAGGIDRVWRAAPFRGNTDVPGKGDGYAENFPSIAAAGPVAEQFGLVTVTDTSQKITVEFKGYSGGQVKMTDSIAIDAPSGTPIATAPATGGTGSTGGTAATAGNPSQLLKIGKQTGWSKFNLGVGYSGSSHKDSDLTAIQNGLVIPGYFEMTADKQRVKMSSHLDGGRTSSNTKYPRTEFRELGLDGSSKASWNAGSGTHRLFCRGRVTRMPPNKPQLCLAQTHDADDDTGMIYVNSKTQVIVKHRGENIGTLTNDFKFGVDYDYGFELVNGQMKYFWGNFTTPRFTRSVSGSGWYFKAGAYGQSNSSTDKTSDGPFIVEMSRCMAWHSGYPNPVG